MITLKALNMSGMFSCGLVQTIDHAGLCIGTDEHARYAKAIAVSVDYGRTHMIVKSTPVIP